MLNLRCKAVLVLGLVMGLTPTSAQVNGRISGTVLDPSGAVVAGANVHLLLPDGKTAVLNTTTTSDGIYSFIGVQPGTYTVSVEAKGFSTSTAAGVVVSPIRETSLSPIKLEIGTVSTTVEVITAAQNVQTGNAEVMSTITNSQIDLLPALNRDVLQLITSQAGVTSSSPLSNGNDNVINGLRSTYTNITLDGINIQDNLFRENGVGFSPNLLRNEQVAEITLSTSNSLSTVGGGASQVNFVSRSGSNTYHGELFWYNRNNAAAANTWFNNQSGVAKPFLNQNVFGGNLGGPIKHDKLFFFGDYETLLNHQQTSLNRVILTPDARNGIFTYTTTGGAVQKVNLLTLRGAAIDPVIQKMLAILPTQFNNFRIGDSSSTLLRNTAGYQFNQRDNSTLKNLTGKIDYYATAKNVFAGSLHVTSHNTDRPTVTGANSYGIIPSVYNDDLVKLFSLSWRWSPSATFTNELRGGANLAPASFKTRDTPPAFFAANSSLLWDSPVPEFLPQGRSAKTITIGDTASYIRGRHNFQFGFNTQTVRIQAYDAGGTVPLYSLAMGTGQNALTGSDLAGISSADLASANTMLASLGGFVNAYSETFNVASRTSGFMNGAQNIRNWRYGTYAGFGQDQWKVMRRLTLTLGVRWDYFKPVDEANGLVLMPVLQNGNTIATLLSNASLDFAGSGTPRPIYNKDLNNFAPNFGFAWDVFGNGRTAVRGGFSINYVDDDNIAVVNNSANTNSGLSTVASVTGLSGRLSAGLPAIPNPTFKVPITEADNYKVNPAANAMGLVDPNLRTPYVEQWNFSIEHEFKNTLFAVRYIGNHGTKEIRVQDFNQVNINANGFLADFQRARTNGNLARAATGVFNPAYNSAIAGSQPLTVFPLLSQGGLLTNGTIRTQIDQGTPGTLATTYTTNGLNGAVNFFPNQYILGGNLTGNYSNSTYNALQIEVRHRYRSGLQFQGNYTFSKALSDSLGDQQSRFEPFLDGTNPSLERARVPYDLTHVFNFNGSYELPFGAGHRLLSHNPILSRIVGGWRLASNVTWQSGAPFSILSLRGTLNRSGNRSAQNTASTSLTGDQLDSVVGFYMTGNGPYFVNPANITADGRGTVQEGQAAFSNQVFTNPGPGSVGTLQRRFFNNPSAFGLDGSIQKVTRITETHTIEFRAEAVNALNHSTFYTGESYNGGAPQSFFNINSTTFGRVNNSFFGARIMQFGLRYRF